MLNCENIFRHTILFLYLCKFTYSIIRDVLLSLLDYYKNAEKIKYYKMGMKLSINGLCTAAKLFCAQESGQMKKELFGVTDGKAIGTFVEHEFQCFLKEQYDIEAGNSVNGLDLPSVNTDIKVTSITQPQSSCPYKNSRQKIYGLGYNLIVFVYQKEDDVKKKKGTLHFVSCIFVDASRTADYQLTHSILEILKNNGNEDDIFALLNDRRVPGDETTLNLLAEEIVKNPPKQGYLTISNALQWRLQYRRIVDLNEKITGINTIVKYEG